MPSTKYTVRASHLGKQRAYTQLEGIYQNKIDIATGTSLTDAQLIFTGTLPDNSSARPEGPHVYHINSTYYLLIAEGEFIQNFIY
jgi:beta-xylosidase